MIALLAVAAILRLWGLTWGLPGATHLFSYHPDEYHSLRALLSLVLFGDPDPHFYNYGSLYLYLVVLAALLLPPGASLTLWADRLVGGDAPALLARWTLDGRLVSVAAGLLTVYVVFLLGRRLLGERGGLWAAALAAVAPLPVLLAHYATVDPTQALFITLALYLSLLYLDQPNRRTLLWAGACAGLAASTKYNGAAVLLAPLLALWLAPPVGERRRGLGALLGQAALLGAAALAAFVLTSPYTLISGHHAWNAFRFEMAHMRQGEALAMAADPSALFFHLKHLLFLGLGPALLLAALGLPAVLLRPPAERLRWYPLLAFAALWTVMVSLAGVRYPRYELPLIAPLCLLLVAPAHLWPGRWRLYSWACGLGLVCALAMSLLTVRALVGPRPQDQALAYLQAHASKSEPVGLVAEPWFGDPPVALNNGGKPLRENPLWARYGDKALPFVVIPYSLEVRSDMPGVFVTTDFSPGDAVRGGNPSAVAFDASLRRHYREVASFGGSPFPWVHWTPGHDWRYAWPRITIWQLREGPAVTP